MKSFTLFNNKERVGKTTTTYHVAHVLARSEERVVMLDFDPQASLTAMFLDDDQLAELWSRDSDDGRTVAGCVDLIRREKGELRQPELIGVADNLWLLAGSLCLSRFEQTLAEERARIGDAQDQSALNATLSLANLTELAAAAVDADYVLVDLGSSLGALNRAALLSCDAVVVPLAPDLFSLQGLGTTGPTLRGWRQEWRLVRERFERKPPACLPAPREFSPIGYIVQWHLARSVRPLRSYRQWTDMIPGEFQRHVLGRDPMDRTLTIDADPSCLALLKHLGSLVPLAEVSRKPMFDLKPADGIGGGQFHVVRACHEAFRRLAAEIRARLEPLEHGTIGQAS